MEIFVNTSFVGFHYWPEAHDSRKYLRNRHRHTFNVYVSCRVHHNDRDIEFHDLIDYVNNIMIKYQSLHNDNLRSCEMMAEYLYKELIEHSFEVTEIRIDEDGECGAIIR